MTVLIEMCCHRKKGEWVRIEIKSIQVRRRMENNMNYLEEITILLKKTKSEKTLKMVYYFLKGLLE